MVYLLKFWKIRRVARELAQLIHSEAWKAVLRITKESAKADEVLSTTKETGRIREAAAVLMGFGVHVVDHYARNFLNQKDRNRLLERIPWNLLREEEKGVVICAAKSGKSMTVKELTDGKKALLNLMHEAIVRLERNDVMHIGGPEYRGDAGQTSLTWCGNMLMAAFTQDSDVPQSKLRAWEEMDAATLKLYDISRAVAWEVHEQVRQDLYRLFEREGFQQIRDLGAVLRV